MFIRTYAKSCVRRKSFYRKSELQMLMLSLIMISGGHICVSKLYTNMASPYKVYNGAWNVSANNSETVGHIDLRLVKLFIYQSFVTLHFLGFFHWTVFNLFFFCTVFIGWQWNGIDARASATSSPGSSRFPIWKARRPWGRGFGLCSQGIGAKKKQREELGSGEVR